MKLLMSKNPTPVNTVNYIPTIFRGGPSYIPRVPFLGNHQQLSPRLGIGGTDHQSLQHLGTNPGCTAGTNALGAAKGQRGTVTKTRVRYRVRWCFRKGSGKKKHPRKYRKHGNVGKDDVVEAHWKGRSDVTT